MSKGKEAVITTGALNSYGSRVLTSGVDLEQYKRNPVILWMHRRYDREDIPIGRMEDIRVEGDQVLGRPVFDEADEFAKKIKHKWENGFLRMVSASLTILELSDAPEHLLPGQTRMTVSRSKLDEVSIVDIGANDDALQLYATDGSRIKLSAAQEGVDIPLLLSKKEEPENINNSKPKKMNKELLLALGLTEGASEAQAIEAAKQLAAKVSAAEALESSLVEGEVKEAVRLGKIPADKEQHFVDLGKRVGIESLRVTLSSVMPAARASSVLRPTEGPSAAAYSKLSDVPVSEVAQLKADRPEEYVRLYRAEFGIEPSSL